MPKGDAVEVSGVITDSLRDGQFRVKLDTGQDVLAYTSGKMRKFHIRMALGDRVKVELSPYDLTRGRITYRQGAPVNPTVDPNAPAVRRWAGLPPAWRVFSCGFSWGGTAPP